MRLNVFKSRSQRGSIKTQCTSQGPRWSLGKLYRAKYGLTAMQCRERVKMTTAHCNKSPNLSAFEVQ